MQPLPDYFAIPLTPNQMGLLDVDVSLNGINGRFHVDTGASQSCLARTQIANLSLVETEMGYMAMGLGGEQKVSKVTIDDFRIDTYLIGRFDLHVIDLSAVNTAVEQLGAAPIDGILGCDFLRQYHAVIDYGDERLYLKIDEP